MNDRDALVAELRCHPVTQGLTDEETALLAAHCSEQRVAPGEVLYQPLEPIDAVGLIVRGGLRLALPAEDGPEQVIRYIGAGDQFGALAVLLDQRFPIAVIADQPTVVLRINKSSIRDLLQQLPVFRKNLSRSVGSALSSTLFEEKRRAVPRVIGWVQFSSEGRGLVDRLARRLAALDEDVALLTDQPEHRGVQEIPVSSLHPGDTWLSYHEQNALLAQLHHVSRILIEVDGADPDVDLDFVMDTCDIVFWVAEDARCRTAIERLQQVVDRAPARKDSLRFVCLFDAAAQVPTPAQPYHTLVQRDFKVPLPSADEGRLQRQAIERIVHHLRGVQIGIALGGGAARGMAHLGVLQAFEESGICFDMISGTSAGALTGIPYAAGYTAEFCVASFARDLQPPKRFKLLPRAGIWYLLSQYRARSWDQMLRKYLYDWRLEQLAVPFHAVAADLISAKQFIHETGDAVRAIVESINLPVLSPPVCRDGMALVDGGALNVLPADVLVNQGCNFVVAVDVGSGIQHEFAGNRPDTPTEKMKTPSIRQTLLRQIAVQDKNMNALGMRPADFVIRPDVSAFDLTDFERTREIAAIGQAAAEQQVARVRESLVRLDPKLFGTVV